MADDADYADKHTETILSAKLSNRVVYTGVSEEFCEDCGIPIPEARRTSIPGCTRCTFCESKVERKLNQHARRQ